jgi:hypothetical protein
MAYGFLVFERQVADSGPGIDQHIVVDQHGRRSHAGRYAAAAP